MHIAIIGASGNIGRKITDEALSRGHQVSGFVRHIEKLPSHKALTPVKADVADGGALAPLLRGHDAVVSSVHFSAFNPDTLLSAIKASGVRRYLVVGGAGSLLLPDGTRVVDSPSFPAAWKAEALGGAGYLEKLRGEGGLDWTFLSPPALIEAGARTDSFRLGKDDLLVDTGGKSHISEEDYAVAVLDELERPQHIRARFTVGY